MTSSRGLSRPQWVGLASAVVAAVGAVLPSVIAGGAGGPLPVGTAGAGIDGLEILTVLFAVGAIGLVLLGGAESREPVGVVGYGLTIAGVALWQILAVGGAASLGVGPYLTLVGAVGLLAAGTWGYRTEVSDPVAASPRSR